MNTINMKPVLASKFKNLFCGSPTSGHYDTGALGYYHIITAPIGSTQSIEGYTSLNSGTFSIDLSSTGTTPIGLFPSSLTSGSKCGLFVGSGTTPPTINDIQLESPITNGLSFSSSIRETNLDENDLPYVKIKCTATNTSSSSIQISEIGYFAAVSYSDLYTSYKGTTKYSTSSYNSHPILLDRVVLDEPIVIPAGEAAVIEYNLTVDMSNM